MGSRNRHKRQGEQRLRLATLPCLHVGKQQFEPIAQRAHVWVRVPLELVALRDDFDGPGVQRSILAGFEAQVEVAGMFGVDAEGVGGSSRVSFCVGFQPCIYIIRIRLVSEEGGGNAEGWMTYQSLPYCRLGTFR